LGSHQNPWCMRDVGSSLGQPLIDYVDSYKYRVIRGKLRMYLSCDTLTGSRLD